MNRILAWLVFLSSSIAVAGPVSPCYWSATFARCLPTSGVLAAKVNIYESSGLTGDVMSIVSPALAADVTITMPATTSTIATLAGTEALTNKTLDNTNTVTLKDTLFTLQDDGDTSKQGKFQLSGITTGTTRTYTVPNASDTLAVLGTAQTFTAKQTLDNAATDIGTASSSSRTLTVLTDSSAGSSPRFELTRNGTLKGRFAAEGTAGTLVTASAVGDLIIASGSGQTMYFTVTPGTTNQGSINGGTGAWTIGQSAAGAKHTLNTATVSTAGIATLTVTNAPTARTVAAIFISININGADYIIPAFLP